MMRTASPPLSRILLPFLRTCLLVLCALLLLSVCMPDSHTAGVSAAMQSGASATGTAGSSATASAPAKNDPAPGKRIHDNPEASEGVNVYRHSAAIHTLARLFGMSIESTAILFEIINFIILITGIAWLVARILPKALRGRSERIQKDLLAARTATEDANRRLENVEQRLARLDEEIAALTAKAEGELAADEERLRVSMEQEKLRIIASAGQEIAAAGAYAQRKLKILAADLAIQHATRLAGVTPEIDRSLTQEFLGDLDRPGRPGGIN